MTDDRGFAANALSAAIFDEQENDDRRTRFTIGDCRASSARRCARCASTRTAGLLSPERDGLSRIYGRRDRARLKLILMGKRVGFSLEAIKEMLDLYDMTDGRLTQLKVAERRFVDQLSDLDRQKREVEEAITELSRVLDIVRGMIRDKEAAAG